jgi:hypothetical protein
MKNLQLSLKKQWFEMTKAGIKTEDYREITPYWVSRLYNTCSLDKPEKISDYLNRTGIINERELEFYFRTFLKPFTTNTITLGYPKSGDTERIIKFEHKGIEIRTGNPEWGAEPNKLYFVILHGKNINYGK